MAALRDLGPMLQSLLTGQPSVPSVFAAQPGQATSQQIGAQSAFPQGQTDVPSPPPGPPPPPPPTGSAPGYTQPSPYGQPPPAWTQWAIPLAMGLGSSLSVPSALGAGPIIGQGLMGAAGSYQSMQQARAQQQLAAARYAQQAAHQAAMERLGQERVMATGESTAERTRHDKAMEAKPSTASTPEERAKARADAAARADKAQQNVTIRYASNQINRFIQQIRAVTDPSISDEELMDDPRIQAEARRISAQTGVPISRLLALQEVPPPPGADTGDTAVDDWLATQ